MYTIDSTNITQKRSLEISYIRFGGASTLNFVKRQLSLYLSILTKCNNKETKNKKLIFSNLIKSAN